MNCQGLIDRVLNQQQNKISHLQEHIHHLKQQLTFCTKHLQNTQRQNYQLTKNFQINERLLREKNQYISALQESNILAQNVDKAKTIKATHLFEESISNQNSIRHLMNNIKILQENNLDLHRQIRILNQRNDDITLQRNNLESQIRLIDLLKNQNSNLVMGLEKYSKQNGFLRERNLELQKQIFELQQNTRSYIENQFNLKTKQIGTQQRLEIQQFKEIIENLMNMIEKKNKMLSQYDYELLEKINQLESSFSGNNNDQIQSFKNAITFMSKQLKNKSNIIKCIKQKSSSFEQYDRKNKELVAFLKEQIETRTNQMQLLKKQNNNLLKQNKRTSKKSNAIVQKQIQQLKNILSELLWENQACHSTLYSCIGPNFKYSIDQEKEKLKKQFDTKKSKMNGTIDNRYLTVQQLVNKNDELMRELSKIAYKY